MSAKLSPSQECSTRSILKVAQRVTIYRKFKIIPIHISHVVIPEIFYRESILCFVIPGLVPVAEPLYVSAKVAKTIDAQSGHIRLGGRRS